MKAWELLDSPEKWTKGVDAKNSYGDDVEPDDSDAICWCLMGAINKCYPESQTRSLVEKNLEIN